MTSARPWRENLCDRRNVHRRRSAHHWTFDLFYICVGGPLCMLCCSCIYQTPTPHTTNVNDKWLSPTGRLCSVGQFGSYSERATAHPRHSAEQNRRRSDDDSCGLWCHDRSPFRSVMFSVPWPRGSSFRAGRSRTAHALRTTYYTLGPPGPLVPPDAGDDTGSCAPTSRGTR